jgi:DNA-binding transcriptional MocR family regulator
MAQMTRAICEYFPEGTKVTRPMGGQVLWVEMQPGFDSVALFQEALQQHNISIAPGVIFSASGSYRNCFRLNCGLPWSPEIERAMQTLGYLSQRMLKG